MTKSERRTKAKLLAKLAQKKRELRKTQSSPNSGTKKGLVATEIICRSQFQTSHNAQARLNVSCSPACHHCSHLHH